MQLSKGQERELYKIMAFWEDETRFPLSSAIKMYFDWTSQGHFPANSASQSYLDFSELVLCRSLAFGMPLSIQERMWLDGYEDYPTRAFLQDKIRESVGNPHCWFRKLPSYELLYNLSLKLHNYAL